MTSLTSDPPASSERPQLRGRQRRGARRHAFHAEVEVLHPSAGQGVTINVSTSGLRIAVDCPLTAGEMCLVRVGEPFPTSTPQWARVVWSRALSDGWIAGLELEQLH